MIIATVTNMQLREINDMRIIERLGQVLLLVGVLALAGCELSDEERPGGPGGHPAAKAATHTGDLQFVTKDLAEGIALAEKSNRPVLAFFTATWCHFCHEMAQDAFTNPQVVAQSRGFVCVLIDADEQKTLCDKYQLKGYPTILFFSPRGVLINRVVGKQSAQDVLQQMQAALQSIAAAKAHPDIQRL